jgi:predicted DNA-binding transcriptional regulator AlpA
MQMGEPIVLLKQFMADRQIAARSTVYRQIEAGYLPPMRRFGLKKVGWYQKDIDALVAREDAAYDLRVISVDGSKGKSMAALDAAVMVATGKQEFE